MTNRRILTPEQAVEIVKCALSDRHNMADTAGAYARGLVEIALDEDSTDGAALNEPTEETVNLSSGSFFTVRVENVSQPEYVKLITNNTAYYLNPANARKLGEALINLAAWLERRGTK